MALLTPDARLPDIGHAVDLCCRAGVPGVDIDPAHHGRVHAAPALPRVDFPVPRADVDNSRPATATAPVQSTAGWLTEQRQTLPNAMRRPVVEPDLEEGWYVPQARVRSEEHTSELQSRENLVCRLLLEKKKIEL